MKLTFFLCLFAYLLAMSTTTSFMGYRYLSLAGEYRARNLVLYDHTQRLLTSIQFRPGLTVAEVRAARKDIDMALRQSRWCVSNLSRFESWLFRQLGAGPAFEICQAGIGSATRAHAILDENVASEGARFALTTSALFDLRREATLMRDQSLAFQAPLDALQRDLRQWVTWGTAVTALGIGILFLLSAREMVRAWRDVNRQRDALARANAEISHNATHDALTGLPNRRAVDAQFRACLDDGQEIVLVRIDLDHFKTVNDTAGHEAGDAVLQHVAEILRDMVPAGSLAARTGGDEFVLLFCPNITEGAAAQLCEQMLQRIAEPILFDGKTLQIGVCFGIAASESGLVFNSDLFQAADAALYEAKEKGRNQVRVYAPPLHAEMHQKRVLALELRTGLRRSEFVPYFHPQFDAVTDEIVGVEVLARWHSVALGLVMPDTFLPVAHDLSLVERIDEQIFAKAIADIQSLAPSGLSIPKVSFNVTASRVTDPDFLDSLRDHPADGIQLAIEILESVLVEEQTDLFKFAVDHLRELGVSVEVDDFGSGHASIIGLMQLRPDVMKIDRRLVQTITADPVTQVAIKGLIDIAEAMGLKVIAEGVETAEHAAILRGLGCHILQGFYYCKPLPIDAFRDFALAHQPALAPRRAGRAAG